MYRKLPLASVEMAIPNVHHISMKRKQTSYASKVVNGFFITCTRLKKLRNLYRCRISRDCFIFALQRTGSDPDSDSAVSRKNIPEDWSITNRYCIDIRGHDDVSLSRYDDLGVLYE